MLRGLSFLALAATTAAQHTPGTMFVGHPDGKDATRAPQRRKLEHEASSGDQGSGSGDQGSGSYCNPCGCKNIPGNYWDAGWTNSNYIFPVPPTFKFNASGCYNSDTSGYGPPTLQYACSATDTSTCGQDYYCQTAGYDFFAPVTDFTTFEGYSDTQGVCVIWHGGTAWSLGSGYVSLGTPDCTCEGYYASSEIAFGASKEHKMHCEYKYNGAGSFDMSSTKCSFY